MEASGCSAGWMWGRRRAEGRMGKLTGHAAPRMHAQELGLGLFTFQMPKLDSHTERVRRRQRTEYLESQGKVLFPKDFCSRLS